MQMLILLLSIF